MKKKHKKKVNIATIVRPKRSINNIISDPMRTRKKGTYLSR